MGRKSSLTPEQWIEAERLVVIEGKSVNSVAKKYGIDEAALRRKLNPNKSDPKNCSKSLKDLAKEKVAAEVRMKTISEEVLKLSTGRQQTFDTLVSMLRPISEHLASAANYGAMTAHKLALIANIQSEKIDEAAKLEDNAEALKSVMAITIGANRAAEIGLNLLAANARTAIKDGDHDRTIVHVDAPDD